MFDNVCICVILISEKRNVHEREKMENNTLFEVYTKYMINNDRFDLQLFVESIQLSDLKYIYKQSKALFATTYDADTDFRIDITTIMELEDERYSIPRIALAIATEYNDRLISDLQHWGSLGHDLKEYLDMYYY